MVCDVAFTFLSFIDTDSPSFLTLTSFFFSAPLYSLDPSSNSCKATQFARFINYSLQGIYSISTNAVTEITCSSSCQAAAPHYSFVWNSLTSTCWCGNSAAVSVEPLFIVSPGSAVNIVGNCINYPICEFIIPKIKEKGRTDKFFVTDYFFISRQFWSSLLRRCYLRSFCWL